MGRKGGISAQRSPELECEGCPRRVIPEVACAGKLLDGTERPTASAVLRINREGGAELGATVPGQHANKLLRLFGQVTVVALLGLAAPISTASADHIAGLGSLWTSVLILVEVVAAMVVGVITVKSPL